MPNTDALGRLVDLLDGKDGLVARFAAHEASDAEKFANLAGAVNKIMAIGVAVLVAVVGDIVEHRIHAYTGSPPAQAAEATAQKGK